ncbi:MAG: hypothetical protein U0Q16_01255 [Bryobacteraceae bacterium]
MKFALPCLVVVAMAMSSTACKRSRKQRVETVEDDKTELSSVVAMSNTAHAVQLVRGFYDLEQGGWRWTMGKFSVTLKTPSGAGEKGATLELKTSVPEAVLSKIQTTTLSASIGGTALEPEKLSKPGEFVYTRNVPASALKSEAVTVDFELDKFLAAGMVEQRELGIIVTSVGLLAK